MLIHFSKMHALGNDFVILDLITQPAKLKAKQIKLIADRHFGIGCDQVIVLEPPIRSTADFSYRIFNPNGQEAEQCGNGARCAARFFYDHRWTQKHDLLADCLAGPVKLTIEADNTVSLELGKPIFKPREIPFIQDTEALTYPMTVQNISFDMSVLSLGNPHAIIQVPQIKDAPVKTLGPLLSTHASFPQAVNVGFMTVLDRSQIQLRTYERGVGETWACGTNSAAAAIAGIRLGLLDSPVTIILRAGRLTVRWDNSHSPVYLRGTTTAVFNGQFSV